MFDNIAFTIRLFADDALMYLALKPKSNAVELQECLYKLAKWEMS